MHVRLLAFLLFLAPAGSASGSPSTEAGEKLFRNTCKCLPCHCCNKSQGPKLGGLFGRKAGTVQDFAYSQEMVNSGIVWSERTLDAFIANPSALVPGNRMASAPTLKDAGDRRALIAWLKLEDTSLDICL